MNGNANAFFFETHTGIDVSVGWRFSELRYLGFGTGVDHVELYYDEPNPNNNGKVAADPLFVDYLRYKQFRKRTQHACFFGVEAGGMIYADKVPCEGESSRVVPLLRAKTGIDYGLNENVGLTVGLNFLISEGSGIGVSLGVRF